MSRWPRPVIRRVQQAVFAGRVRLTHKALAEVASLGIDEMDALDILLRLAESDAFSRFRSERGTGWMYVFRPVVAEVKLYVKLMVKDGCVVISLHEDEDGQTTT